MRPSSWELLRVRRFLGIVTLVLLPQETVGLLCAAPPDIPDGSHSGTGSPYTYGIVITYNCSENFSLIGAPSISCGVDNTQAVWKGKLPKCKVVKCKDPVIEHGIILSGFGHLYTYGDNITFECKIGYFMIGSYLIRCEENSTWCPEVPSCKKIHPQLCGAPLIPSGAVHPLQHQYKIGMVVAVTCSRHYSFPDETMEMRVACQGYNLWDPPVQPCFFRTSPDTFRLSIRNGKIVHGKKSNYEPGDTVTVECSAGYTLIGPSEIRYIGGKQWSPKMPSCSLNTTAIDVFSVASTFALKHVNQL
ncbi:C4b-binding protein alpha chain-like [Rhineura floridana]|uniref:C4b-binding protein alpha chain-like n=1 Tax=Rhineura floridana TaxID=261503 RepID=UPI002AC80F52|nr:C4b-binding protein alpha chain-like [Rhineura floridana]